MSKQAKLETFLKEHGIKEVMKKYEEIQESRDLPEGWKWVKLEDISVRIMGGTPKTSVPHFWNGNIVWVTAKTITEDQMYVYNSERKITKEGLKNSNAKLVPKGAVLLVTTGATAGKVAIAGVDLATNQQITAIIPKDGVFNIYLYYALKFFKNRLLELGGKTTFKHINQENLAKFKIPLPPLEEQKRIVSRLEQLIGRVEEAKRFRKAAKEETEKIMQAALNKVFSRAKREAWKQIRLREIARVRYGKAKPKEVGNVPVVGSGGIYAYTSKALVDFPTLVIGRKGTAGEVWMMDIPCWPSDTTFYLEWRDFSSVDPCFVFWHLKFIRVSGGRAKTTLPSLLRQELEDYLLFLPPLEKQKRIVAYLNKISEKVESLKELQLATDVALENLVPIILDKAFRGQL